MEPDLVSVVTAHMVYFCAFAQSEISPKKARELGMGCRQFHSGINGLIELKFTVNKGTAFWEFDKCPFNDNLIEGHLIEV